MKLQKNMLIFILFMLTSFVYAQDKYEFMIVEYNRTMVEDIRISIDGKSYLTEKALPMKGEEYYSSAPLLSKVSEYQDKGWELMNFETIFYTNSSQARVYFAYMRKKK